jgi:hypothetical protein
MNKYVLKFTFDKNQINKQLIPWQRYFDREIIDNQLNSPLSNSNREFAFNSEINAYHSIEDEEYQIGLAIKKSDNQILFVSPFFVHIPYSEIGLLNCGDVEIKLKLKTYCFFTKLALFEFDSVETINKKIYSQILENAFDIESLSVDLSNIDSKKIYINPIDDINILTTNNQIVFKNMINDNIYPFIWIESEIDREFITNSGLSDFSNDISDDSDNHKTDDHKTDDPEINDPESIYNKLLSGTPIYSHSDDSENINNNNDIFMGIIYNCDDKINIIPCISIIKLIIKGDKLENVFIEYDINPNYVNMTDPIITDPIITDLNMTDLNISDLNHTKSKSTEPLKINTRSKLKKQKNKSIEKICPIIIKQIYSNPKSGLKKELTDFEIGDHIHSLNNIPIVNDGYIFFADIDISIPLNTYIWYSLDNKLVFDVYRRKQNIKIKIDHESLNDKISIDISKNTRYLIKDNVVFCVLNLMMIEWLSQNDIRLCNTIYLQYMNNPYFKPKHNYLLVGLINIKEHPLPIQDIFKPYEERIYSVRKYLELFTILNINVSKTTNIDKHKSIDRLIICDSSEKELSLSWIS